MAETTSPVIPKISFPVPSDASGTEFSTAGDLLQSLDREASGLYLVGGNGMWHGGIHITDSTAPWCALTGNAPPEQTYAPTPHKGVQHLRCMADGDIVAFRVCREYPTIPWEERTLYLSGSFVLVRHYVQPGTTAASGLTFYTLYMHLAPFSAYASQTDPRQRTTKGGVKFYLTKEDVASNKVAGNFSAGNVVILCDETMVRRSDNHQFSQVKMQDGRRVWTVSDGGFLKMAESNGASPPPWWSQCSPAYNVTPPTAAVYKNITALNYYCCREDVVFETVVSGQNKKWGKPAGKLLPVNTPMTMETDNAAQTVTRPDNRVFKLMTMTADVAGTPLKGGERVWVVADGGNLEAVAAQTGAAPKFDEVITDQKIPVQAGASLGHLGFFQIPTETGFRSRYMVHIECLTSDSKVASFLTNPQAAGRESPAFLKYPADAALFSQDAQGAMAKSTRKTKATGILTLSKVPTVSADGTPTHYQIRPEGGFLAAASVELLSQFDLGKLGFSIIKDDPESFQLLDAENQPQNVVKGIFEKLKAAAENDTVFSNALASHKYKQLLDVIDQNNDGYYSVDEYRNAVHNPTYRDPLYQLIVQHPSEWYYEKTDPKWTKYLEKLEPDASKWKKYTEAFLDKMIWMKKVAGMGPAPWHMHPVMFMEYIRQQKNHEIIFPLMVKPENDPGKKWSYRYWRDINRGNAAAYGRPRSGGRQHGGRDLYTNEYEPVVAICDGIILGTFPFYDGTNEVSILHNTKDGRKFIVRYGELDPQSIMVRTGEEINQGQKLGNTGRLINNHGQPTVILDHQIVYMLHFELYTGNIAYSLCPSLTNRSNPPFSRRGDLVDPINILIEGYENTFKENNEEENNRSDISNLHTSIKGKEFIKSWELLKLSSYNDSEGNCSIGFGHLIEYNRCEKIILPAEFKNGIDEVMALNLFDNDLTAIERGVKRSISVNLYQHEFDALVSLLFNCGEFFLSSGGAPNLLALLNAKQYEQAANEFLDITNGGDSGLIRRRQAENDIFLNNEYNSVH
ncbi:glycoside hydrolase family protein [Rahnella inusitata]